MEDLQPETTLFRAVRFNINQIEEKIDSVRVYKEELEKILYKEFPTEYCQIYTGGSNVTATLHLLELTQVEIRKLNEIASTYTIEPCGSDVVSLKIFQFKELEE